MFKDMRLPINANHKLKKMFEISCTPRKQPSLEEHQMMDKTQHWYSWMELTEHMPMVKKASTKISFLKD